MSHNPVDSGDNSLVQQRLLLLGPGSVQVYLEEVLCVVVSSFSNSNISVRVRRPPDSNRELLRSWIDCCCSDRGDRVDRLQGEAREGAVTFYWV